ncbi:MAG: helix-turn-helix domain-containing protein [bacterium]
MVERAVILCNTDTIEVEHLPRHLLTTAPETSEESIAIGKELHEIEKEVIFKTLKQTNNNKTKAAQILGISLKTMHNKLNKYFSEEE